MSTATEERIMAVVWRDHLGYARGWAHAVEMRRGSHTETETDRLLPTALCGFTPARGWGYGNRYTDDVAERGCPRCKALYATWGDRQPEPWPTDPGRRRAHGDPLRSALAFRWPVESPEAQAERVGSYVEDVRDGWARTEDEGWDRG